MLNLKIYNQDVPYLFLRQPKQYSSQVSILCTIPRNEIMRTCHGWQVAINCDIPHNKEMLAHSADTRIRSRRVEWIAVLHGAAIGMIYVGLS